MDSSSRSIPIAVQGQFTPETTYLNTATSGLLPDRARQALERQLHDSAVGRFTPGSVDPVIADCRATYARLVGVPTERVVIGTHVAQFAGTIAASLQPGAEVLVAQNEFSSVVFPFLAREDHGIRVREVPLERLPDEVGPDTSLVAVSSVQSADGALAPVDDLVTACADHRARLMLDTTQSTGWLPLAVERVDYTVCSAYKWLLGQRGSALMTGTPEALAALEPMAPNWFAGAEPWNSLYGGPLRLADGARRLDLAPVWPAWIGLAESLELLHQVGVESIHRHNTSLADDLRTRLDLEPAGSAIVSLPVSEETSRRVAEAGIRTASRDGRMRASFHLYNDAADVERLVKALG